MSSSLGKSFGLSSSLKEEVTMTKKQGIVSILGNDSERTKSDASLKRTRSADMSSKKWLCQHDFFLPLEKTPSSQGFQVCFITNSSSSEEDDYEERHQVEEKKKVEEKAGKQPGQLDPWNSILSQKAQEDSKNLPPPYIHPKVKRSASSLSGKSLEICTESLGSETGSGGFSSYPPSETGDAEEDKEEERQQQQQQQQQEKAVQKYDMEDWRVPKYKFVSSKKTSPRSFPPPIPSLSSQDGASVHMRSRRDNGRLVLEAVSVASQNNFRAQRQDGRLILTFINKTNEEEQEGPKNEESKKEKNEVDQFELELDDSEDEIELDDQNDGEEEEEEETEEDVEEEVEKKIDGGGGGGGAGGDGEELRFVMDLAPEFSSGIVSFHRLAPMMNKSTLLAKRNPTYPKSLNKTVNFEAEEEEAIMKTITPLTQSLPPPKATVAATANAAASLNAYEYYWKPEAITVKASVLSAPIAQSQATRWNSNKLILSKNIVGNEQHELLVLRGNNGDYFVPFFKGCKEPRRSLLFWEPYCIATS